MPLSSYISDLIAPFWATLTNDQRSDWHFFAVDNPIINTAGELVTVNGWQMFVHVNAWLAVGDSTLMLPDPPADLVSPDPFNLSAQVWPAKLKLPGGSTYRSGRIFLDVDPAIPSNRIVFVMRTSQLVSPWSLVPWPLSHLSYIAPGFSGLHDLSIRNGYSLSTPGSTYEDRQKLIGPYAKSHPKVLAARLIIASTDNGMATPGAIANSKART